MGRSTSVAGANSTIEKHLQHSSQQHKICSKVGELCHLINLTLDKIELLASDEIINTDMSAVMSD